MLNKWDKFLLKSYLFNRVYLYLWHNREFKQIIALYDYEDTNTSMVHYLSR